MTTAWVLTAAMPPTRGHANIIEFAKSLPVEFVRVLQVSRINEPMQEERLEALKEYFCNEQRVVITGVYIDSPGPETDDYWVELLKNRGFQKEDFLVASEFWGQYIAVNAGGTFIPYDYVREIQYTRATEVRSTILEEWGQILPTFQKILQKRITIFGAESVGKTTLSKRLAKVVPNSISTVEFARPYLETVGGELTIEKMRNIVVGQAALQKSLGTLSPAPSFMFLDTDLYSTLGYWEFWSPDTIPPDLPSLANELKSDIYLLVRANIPFEEDQLRYGGSKREKPDSYWEGVLKKYDLPYEIIEPQSLDDRVLESRAIASALMPTMKFERLDN